MLFNKRSEHVDKHKGEIAFPGGGWESGDATILDTALRETWEEMSIDPADVTVLGELDDIVTISDFVVTPYVGAIPGVATTSSPTSRLPRWSRCHWKPF